MVKLCLDERPDELLGIATAAGTLLGLRAK
jgi:hypothetical protein